MFWLRGNSEGKEVETKNDMPGMLETSSHAPEEAQGEPYHGEADMVRIEGKKKEITYDAKEGSELCNERVVSVEYRRLQIS